MNASKANIEAFLLCFLLLFVLWNSFLVSHSDGESGQSDALQPVADAASVDSDDYYVSQIKLLQFGETTLL